MKQVITLLVNGDEYGVAVEPQVTLLEVLREEIHLTGTKGACGTGECGSCTVLMDGVPVLSCLLLAVDCQQQRITTIEGIARNGNLSSLQQAFHEVGAVQCGYCTPGMIVTATALLAENHTPKEAEIQQALGGNLCRCTGYNKIMKAVQRAALR